MTLLLDTHTLLWFLKNDPQLSVSAKTALENPANRKVVSIVSCWEIAIKAGLGKLKLRSLRPSSCHGRFRPTPSTCCRLAWPTQLPSKPCQCTTKTPSIGSLLHRQWPSRSRWSAAM